MSILLTHLHKLNLFHLEKNNPGRGEMAVKAEQE